MPETIPMPATTLTARVDARLSEAFLHLGLPVEHAFCVPSGKPELADFQCNGAMPSAKAARRSPKDIAADVCALLADFPEFSEASVAGPGFINMRLSHAFVGEAAAAQAADPSLGIQNTGGSALAVIDFGGPNVAKPLHVGHMRSLVIGESLRRILLAIGHRVLSDVHLGDWGLQMGMLTSAIRLMQPDLPYFQSDAVDSWPKGAPVTLDELEQLYPAAAAACKADSMRMAQAREDTARLQAHDPGLLALWRALRTLSLSSQCADFAILGAHFDLLDGESDAQPLIRPMLDSLRACGMAVESDGALVVHVSEPGDRKEMPPLLLAKSDGAALYATTDLATLMDRVQRLEAERIVYVVDQRQALHFEQVFRAARKTGLAGGAVLEHVGFGTVNGPDGKPYKTRDGGVARLSDLVEEAVSKAAERVAASGQGSVLDAAMQADLARMVGIGALKFADLSGDRMSGYVFDPEWLVAFEGRTGPYVQYACVRIRSILAKAADESLVAGPVVVGRDSEHALLLACLAMPAAVCEAAKLLQPGILAEHSFQLAQAFSRFYADCPVLGAADSDVRASRLGMCELVGKVLGRVLELLGIQVPVWM
jgi:arginyl-tRNA synthetase